MKYPVDQMRTIWLSPEEAEAVDRFLDERPDLETLQQALRALVSEQLMTLGLLPHRDDPGGAN